MKTLEFNGLIAQNSQIAVPPQIAEQIPAGETVKIILEWGSSIDDGSWTAKSKRTFNDAYAPEDAVYEALDR